MRPSIRINTLKITVADFKKLCKAANIQLKSVLWYTDAFIVENKTTRELTDWDAYEQGLFYIQNLSSMLPALELDPQENETILDLCAAPGSKTTQLAAMMNNTGKIVANDMSRQRLYKLEENLKRMGVTNTEVRFGAGERIWQKYPEYFDKTLADVPCSMQQELTQKKIKQLAKQQQWLLRAAISATKPGGIIVYSTCTLTQEENEGVIEWILKKEKGNVELEEIKRIDHSDEMEGFFVAKLKKLKSNVRLRE